MESIAAFFDMGGHAAFVWPSYALAAGILGALVVLSLREMRGREALLQTLRGSRRREAGR